MKSSQVGYIAKKKSESDIFGSLRKEEQIRNDTNDPAAPVDETLTPTGKTALEKNGVSNPDATTPAVPADSIPRKKFRKISMSTHQESTLPINIFDKAKILQ